MEKRRQYFVALLTELPLSASQICRITGGGRGEEEEDYNAEDWTITQIIHSQPKTSADIVSYKQDWDIYGWFDSDDDDDNDDDEGYDDKEGRDEKDTRWVRSSDSPEESRARNMYITYFTKRIVSRFSEPPCDLELDIRMDYGHAAPLHGEHHILDVCKYLAKRKLVPTGVAPSRRPEEEEAAAAAGGGAEGRDFRSKRGPLLVLWEREHPKCRDWFVGARDTIIDWDDFEDVQYMGRVLDFDDIRESNDNVRYSAFHEWALEFWANYKQSEEPEQEQQQQEQQEQQQQEQQEQQKQQKQEQQQQEQQERQKLEREQQEQQKLERDSRAKTLRKRRRRRRTTE